MLSSSQYIVSVAFAGMLWAVDLMVTFVPAMRVTGLLPSAATANIITSPAYGDDRLFTISAALGSAIFSAELDVSKRNKMYWSN